MFFCKKKPVNLGMWEFQETVTSTFQLNAVHFAFIYKINSNKSPNKTTHRIRRPQTGLTYAHTDSIAGLRHTAVLYRPPTKYRYQRVPTLDARGAFLAVHCNFLVVEIAMTGSNKIMKFGTK